MISCEGEGSIVSFDTHTHTNIIYIYTHRYRKTHSHSTHTLTFQRGVGKYELQQILASCSLRQSRLYFDLLQ